tara:strand:+ start:2278 stop:2385 length:108 start_codon:yes stop_codon:yes gene_type:complete
MKHREEFWLIDEFCARQDEFLPSQLVSKVRFAQSA